MPVKWLVMIGHVNRSFYLQLATLGDHKHPPYDAPTPTVVKIPSKNSWIRVVIQLTELRSATTRVAVTHRPRTNRGRRAFSIAGPSVWNSLPQSLRLIDDHEQFRKQLKTYSQSQSQSVYWEMVAKWLNSLNIKQEFVRPRWPYDMRPSARAEKYIHSWPISENRSFYILDVRS